MRSVPFFLFIFFLCGCASRKPMVPPVLVDKQANRWQIDPAGTTKALESPVSTRFELFIPEGTEYDANGATTLALHFHGASWFMQQEHARREALHPLLTANATLGDAAYENDIMQEGVLQSLLDQINTELVKAGGPQNAHIDQLELSGFSAGYSGVRGVLRLPKFEPMVSRVLLGDSLYVGDGDDSNPPDDRKPRRGEEGIDPFIAFAQKAAAGERTLLMEHSTTPSMRSVGPMDCSRYVIEALGLVPNTAELDSIPASRQTADYQLVWRADKGNAHFWCYDSPRGRPIHLAHVRNQADMWRALDGLTSLEAQPPAMPQRPISPSESLPSDSIELDLGIEGTVTLFLPTGYKVPSDGSVELTVNFHATTWFVIQEHLRRGLGDPLVALELGQGSTVYRVPFEDPLMLQRLMDAVVVELKKRDSPEQTHIASLNLTSFSAGYGAVREIIKSPEYVELIRRIVLGDSSYGSLDDAELENGNRVVAQEHVAPWAEFAKLAMTGDKTLLMLTSDIKPATYAGTMEVAHAVAKEAGAKIRAIKPDSCAAANSELDYPLHTRADAGSFHWWSYGGDDAVVHMTLARHIAEAWGALDQAGDP